MRAERGLSPRLSLATLVAALLLAFAAMFARDAVAEEDDSQGESAASDDSESAEAQGDDAENSDGKDAKKDGEASPFDAVMKLNQRPAAPGEGEAKEAEAAPQGEGAGATATLPLAEYSELARRVEALRRAKAALSIAPVVLGAASYEGEVDRSVLALRMKLVVTLSGEGLKFVPLVGDDVALVSASAGDEAISVTRRPGYHVWVTDRVGVVTLELSLLVGPRGGRGSTEYAFRSARTPSTKIAIRLPLKGISPRFDSAVESESAEEKGGTTARATLAPTTSIRMVGLRDVKASESGDGSAGSASGANELARSVAETISLLSVDERAIELFTVVRYTILRGALQTFDVALPPGLDVVSADGEGAFHYTVERKDEQAIVRGETALPIEGSYELSLRLRRRGAAHPDALEALLPRCLGVEREHGWLAVEAPGKLRIAETKRADLVPVAVAELPTEARSSAVSPVLKAYRYYASAPSLGLSIERLPEQDLEEAAVNAVEATSVLAAEGKLVTELRVTLRNASRPSLAMTLPPATEVRSAIRDGEPVRPSRDDAGRLLLPLARSGGEGHDQPIALEVVVESTVPPLGLFGAPELALPALDLGAAAWKWRLYLPSNNHYGELRARLDEQRYAGSASWHKPAHLKRAVRWNEEDPGSSRESERPSSSWSELLGSGTEKVHERYWVEPGEIVRVRVPFIRGFFVLPFELAAGAIAIGAVVYFARRRGLGARAVAAARYTRTRLPARLWGWARREAWSRRRVARAIMLTAAFVAVSWLFIERAAGLVRVIRATLDIA